MSSFVRRLTIRLIKRAGYSREKWFIQKLPTGETKVVNVRRGGEITDRDDNPIGRLWPLRLPADAALPKRAQKQVVKIPRGSRRGKPNKAYIARRKAIREASEQSA